MTTMTSSNVRKPLRRPKLLLLAISVLGAGAAAAADRAVDAQEQARNVITGIGAGGSSFAAQPNLVDDNDSSVPTFDPQERAREILLGVARSGGRAKAAAAAPNLGAPQPAKVIRLGDRRARGDAQDMARRVVLGEAV